MLRLRITAANGGPAALTTYRDAIDLLRGFPIPNDPFGQHFADVEENVVARAKRRVNLALAASATPDPTDVHWAADPLNTGEAWCLDIADAWPLASDPSQMLTPTQMQHLQAFPAGAVPFDWDTSDPEWTIQIIGP